MARLTRAPLTATALLVIAALLLGSPAAAVQSVPADTAGTPHDRLAIVVVLVGLGGLLLFGVRRVGMRMLGSRRAHRS